MSKETESGPRRKTTNNQVLMEIKALVGPHSPVVTAAELAEELDVTKKTINNRLNELEASGKVEFKQAGRTNVWWPRGDPLNDSVLDLNQLEQKIRELEERFNQPWWKRLLR